MVAGFNVAGHAASAGLLLGLVLVSPQAAGLAHADSPDTGAVAAGAEAADSTGATRGHGHRPPRAGSASAPTRAGNAGRSAQSPKPAASALAPVRFGPAASRRAQTVRRPADNALPSATSTATTAIEVPPAAAADPGEWAVPTPRILKAVVRQSRPAATAALAAPPALSSASMTAPLTQAFDRVGHWLAGLPASPVGDLLSGVLLMVRRTLPPQAPAAQARAAISKGDGSGPVLTAITSTPGSRSLVLTFNGPLLPGTATDLANYSITAPGCGNPEVVTSSGRALKIVDAQYGDISASSSQVTLTLARPLRNGTFYRVSINGEAPIISGDPNSNPLTGGGDPSNADYGVTFDGDNDETAGGDFYGQFAVGRRLSFTDSSGDRVVLTATDGEINVWRELNGDIDQITVLPGATALTGSVVPAGGGTVKVYIGSITVPVPTPLNLNGAADNLPPSFQVVPAGGLTTPPPVPTATSPKPVPATASNLPYTLNITPVSAPGITNLPGIQSGVYAQVAPTAQYPSGLWLVFGGRTNGLHDFSPSGEQSFPPSFQNQSIYVINPVDWQVWSRPWSQTDVPAAVYNSISSGSQEFFQKGDTLYTVGGYSKPGTVQFTGDVSRLSPSITVTSGLENLAVGQSVSGVLPFPSGQEIFPPGTTITAIDGTTITASSVSEVDATGAGLAAYTRDFKTYDTLTALSVAGLAEAVINGGDVAGPAKIRQISDPRLAVAGGGIGQLNGRTYLVFGHNFQGGYNGATADIAQVYTDEVRSFRILDTGRRLAITGYRAQRDPVNFRRRDGNLVNSIGAAGSPQLTYLGGVFTPGDDGTGYQAPIMIGPAGRARVDAAYQQYFNQYTTSHIPLYDKRTRSMYDILMGGISLYVYSDGQLTEKTDLPWVAYVISLAQARDGSFQEYVMSPIPPVTADGTGYYGAGSAFFGNQALPAYCNGVTPLNRLSGPTVMGYMYGGIYSTVSETSGNTFGQTGASNQVFQVTLTPA